MRNPDFIYLGTVGLLLIVSVNSVAADTAKRGQEDVDVQSCIQSSYDPRLYNWLSFRNTCDEPLRLTWIYNKPGRGGSSKRLLPGKADSTGYSKSEIDKRGGYVLAVCRDGYTPMDAKNHYWDSVTDAFHCKANAATATSDNSDTSAIELMKAAWKHKGKKYGSKCATSMKCSDLIQDSAREIGKPARAYDPRDSSVTHTWFFRGMGEHFVQIGEPKGLELRRIALQVGSKTLSMPIGTVIVGNGHAAIFTGVKKVDEEWRLIIFDSNATDGVVGEHQTGTHWRSTEVVKLFVPK